MNQEITFTTDQGAEIHFQTQWERDDAIDAYYSPMYCNGSTEELIDYLKFYQAGFWVQHPDFEQVYWFRENT